MQSPSIVVEFSADAAVVGFTERLAYVDDPRDGPVEVPDVHAPVFAAAVEVLLARGGGRGEVASDKGFEDFVAGVGCYAAVLGVAG